MSMDLTWSTYSPFWGVFRFNRSNYIPIKKHLKASRSHLKAIYDLLFDGKLGHSLGIVDPPKEGSLRSYVTSTPSYLIYQKWRIIQSPRFTPLGSTLTSFLVACWSLFQDPSPPSAHHGNTVTLAEFLGCFGRIRGIELRPPNIEFPQLHPHLHPKTRMPPAAPISPHLSHLPHTSSPTSAERSTGATCRFCTQSSLEP